MYSCLRILSILAFAALLFLECAVSKHCFRIRHPRRGTLGRCEDEINLQRDRTKEACCYAGGAGWAVKPNGIKCKDACEGVVDGPEPNPDQPEKETTIQPTINDEGEEKYCFLERQAKGSLGSCTSPIGMKTKKGCCNGGGKGWTERESGIRCEDPCIVGYCFDTLRQKQRDRGNKCSDLSGEMDKNQCCQARGSGWSNLSDGRKCVAPCEQDQGTTLRATTTSGTTAPTGTTAEVTTPRRDTTLEATTSGATLQATTSQGTTAKGTTAEVTTPRRETTLEATTSGTTLQASTPPGTTAPIGTTSEATTPRRETTLEATTSGTTLQVTTTPGTTAPIGTTADFTTPRRETILEATTSGTTHQATTTTAKGTTAEATTPRRETTFEATTSGTTLQSTTPSGTTAKGTTDEVTTPSTETNRKATTPAGTTLETTTPVRTITEATTSSVVTNLGPTKEALPLAP